MATIHQISKIHAIRRNGNLDYEDVLNEAEEVAGRSIKELEDLSQHEASELIDKLEDEVGT